MIVVRKPAKGIVWLASYPKSGNTWLRMFLYQVLRIKGGHPREPDELNKLDRASGYEARLVGLFDQVLGKPLADATQEEVMSVRAAVHATVADRMPTVTMLKTHNLLGHIGSAPLINLAMTVGAIYLVRDPRDVAPSLAKHHGSTIDQAIAVMNTHGYANDNQKDSAFEIWGSWSQHVQSWTMQPSDAIMVVRYEDMMAKPTETFGAILKHLRQSLTPEQLTEAIELSSFDRLSRAETELDFKERSERADRFFVSGKAGGWRDKLTEAQAQTIVEAHHDEMGKLGYLN